MFDQWKYWSNYYQSKYLVKMSVFIRLKSCFHCFIPSSRSEWTTSSYSTCYSLSTQSLSWTFVIRRAFIINQTDFVLSLRIDYCPCGILPGVVPLGPKVVSIYIGHENRMLVKPRHQHINRDCGFLALIKLNNNILLATSMLVTDIGDEMC